MCFSDPDYRYPHAFFFLDMLQVANFRAAMAHPANKVSLRFCFLGIILAIFYDCTLVIREHLLNIQWKVSSSTSWL